MLSPLSSMNQLDTATKHNSYVQSTIKLFPSSALQSEKAMALHSSTLAWKIPWVEEPGRLQSMGSLRVGHDWATSFTFHFHASEKDMATHSSVLAWRIPGTGQLGGLLSMGSHRVGHEWSDLAAAAAASTRNLKEPGSSGKFLFIRIRVFTLVEELLSLLDP